MATFNKANVFKGWLVYLIYLLWTLKKRNLIVFSLVPICCVAPSVPDFIPGLFRSVLPLLCGNAPSLSFAPVFASFDLEQLIASELVLSSVKWEEWWDLSTERQRGWCEVVSSSLKLLRRWVSADVSESPDSPAGWKQSVVFRPLLLSLYFAWLPGFFWQFSSHGSLWSCKRLSTCDLELRMQL